MNSSYGGLHISVNNKRNKEASVEVYIQDKKYDYFWEIKSMARNFCSNNLAEEIENWTIYHCLILLMIIKLNIMNNQSKRRVEKDKVSFYR